MTENLTRRIEENGIVAIFRKIGHDDLLQLTQALSRGGIQLFEVTFDQKDEACIAHTSEAIGALCAAFPGLSFGAGTVLTKEQVTAAADAGGQFIISPNTDLEVIRHTKQLGMVSIPGAMTPSEVMTAHCAGADFVKLFPAGYLGVPYVKDLTSPISHVKLLATGGVDLSNFGPLVRAGCCGAGLGSSLCDRKKIKAGDWDGLTQLAREYVGAFRQAKENA